MSDKDASFPKPIALLTRDPVSGVPLTPKHPQRICWGCNKFCPENDLACGNGTIRTPHPIELFGDDWLEWSIERENKS
jgi:hypothetical protein